MSNIGDNFSNKNAPVSKKHNQELHMLYNAVFRENQMQHATLNYQIKPNWNTEKAKIFSSKMLVKPINTNRGITKLEG